MQPFVHAFGNRAAIRLDRRGKVDRRAADDSAARIAVDLFGRGIAGSEHAILNQQHTIRRLFKHGFGQARFQ